RLPPAGCAGGPAGGRLTALPPAPRPAPASLSRRRDGAGGQGVAHPRVVDEGRPPQGQACLGAGTLVLRDYVPQVRIVRVAVHPGPPGFVVVQGLIGDLEPQRPDLRHVLVEPLLAQFLIRLAADAV